MSKGPCKVQTLLDAVIVTGAGEAAKPWGIHRTFQAFGTTSAGAGAATILIEVRNGDDADWITLGTITLTLGTTQSSDGFASAAAWEQVRANVDSISGTDATVSVVMGNEGT